MRNRAAMNFNVYSTQGKEKQKSIRGIGLGESPDAIHE